MANTLHFAIGEDSGIDGAIEFANLSDEEEHLARGGADLSGAAWWAFFAGKPGPDFVRRGGRCFRRWYDDDDMRWFAEEILHVS